MENIRHATKKDKPAIVALMKSIPGIWDNGWRENVIDIILDRKSTISFVCEESGHLLGFICAHDNGFRAYLSELVVSPLRQKKGIGRSLVEKMKEEVKRRGIKIVIADVWKDSVDFYVRMKFRHPDVVLLAKDV